LTSNSPTDLNADNPFERNTPPDKIRQADEIFSDVVHLGLTFSFPVEQTALGSGTILTWTKGFSAKNAVCEEYAACSVEAHCLFH
jgi:hexokinase